MEKQYVEQFQKPKLKKQKKNIHDFSQKVKKKEYEEAKGLCRICHSEPITQYHHINEKGMGGGKGLGIQINCLGVGDRCHNHDNTEFLRACDRILESRIEKAFTEEIEGFVRYYGADVIAIKLGMDIFDVFDQMSKGFLRVNGLAANRESIKRWLMSKGVVA